MSDVKLPRAIQAQNAIAEQIQREIIAAENAAPKTTPLAALGVSPTPSPDPEQTLNSAPPPAEPLAPQALAPEPPRPPVNDQAEQRFRTLQGILTNEINPLRQELKEALQQNKTLVASVEQLVEQRKAASSEAAVPDPKDMETFGADLVAMVRRQASSEIEAAVRTQLTGFVKRLDNLEAGMQTTGKQLTVSAEQAFFDTLASRAPDWRIINADQRFLQWLGEVDLIYGMPRQAALDHASETRSVERTVAIFDAFKASIAPPPSPTPPPPKPPAPQPLQDPARSGATPPPSGQTTEIISSDDVTAFYNDVARGKVYRGRDAERVALEQRIDQAIAEGRVR